MCVLGLLEGVNLKRRNPNIPVLFRSVVKLKQAILSPWMDYCMDYYGHVLGKMVPMYTITLCHVSWS